LNGGVREGLRALGEGEKIEKKNYKVKKEGSQEGPIRFYVEEKKKAITNED